MATEMSKWLSGVGNAFATSPVNGKARRVRTLSRPRMMIVVQVRAVVEVRK